MKNTKLFLKIKRKYVFQGKSILKKKRSKETIMIAFCVKSINVYVGYLSYRIINEVK